MFSRRWICSFRCRPKRALSPFLLDIVVPQSIKPMRLSALPSPILPGLLKLFLKVLSFKSFDLSPCGPKFLFDFLVATIEVVDAINDCDPVRN